MKKLSFIFLIICILLVSCGKSDEFVIPNGEIVKITVTSSDGVYNNEYTDEASMKKLVNYFSTLSLTKDFSENPDEYNGETVTATFTYSDGSEISFYHLGNMFIRSDDSRWFKMNSDEAARLSGILEDLK